MLVQKSISPIIKVTESCNFDCAFCHYAKNPPGIMMSVDLCKKILRQAIEYNVSNSINEISFTFHGGEPLLCGLDYFEQIVEEEAVLLDEYPNLTIRNQLQTNGSLLNGNWIEFFEKHNFGIGMSFDGDEHLNFHHPQIDGGITNTLSKYNEAKEKANCGLLSVITKKHVGNHEKFYNFCISNHINRLGMCYCFNEEGRLSISNKGLSRFVIEFFDLYFYGSYELDVREFKNAMGKVLRKKTALCTMNGRKKCGEFLTFDALGNVFFCDKAYDKSKSLGNIEKSSILDVISNNPFQAEKNNCISNIKNCEANCEVFDICGGGCYRHDIYVSGKMENYFCEAYKEIYTHIRKTVNRAVKEGLYERNDG